MNKINLGSVEIVSCLLTDRLGNVDTIASADFKIISEDETLVVQDWATAENIVGMRVDCLVDTTGIDWVEGTYKLYVRCSVPPETPIVGPFEFGVS